ncbi:MAG TPA: DUF5123 domain-containing protein, partial [Chitinophagaceae bacterium]|nr:DUF5123 domain-containing protein [Chitinophagaceae bacterium]
ISHTSDVLVSWDPSLYTSSTDTSVIYTVQISKDSTFQSEPLFEFTTDTTGFRLTDEKIEVRQKYFARVRANNLGDRPSSQWVVSHGFQIQGIQIMLTRKTKVQSTKVQLHWIPQSDISQLVLVADSIHGFDTTRINITSSEVSSGIIEVDNLSPNTIFHVELYTDQKSVGYANFKTKPAINGHIVDLSSITGRPEILSDTLSNIPAGSVVLLKRGANYAFNSGYSFEKSVTIMSKPGFTERAHIDMDGSSLNVEEDLTLDSIVFKDLTISGEYGSSYLLNVSRTCEVAKIEFNNCKLNNMRGVFRIKSSNVIQVNNINYFNCVIDSINGYGVMNINNSAAQVNNIRLRNTTISNAQIIIAGEANVDSVLFGHCTFYNAPARSGKFTVDFGHDNKAAYVGFTSCLFGKTEGTKGARIGDGAQLYVSNSYKTNDYESTSKDITGLILFDQPSNKVFKDPKNRDFTIIDSNFPAVGDPRWLP